MAIDEALAWVSSLCVAEEDDECRRAGAFSGAMRESSSESLTSEQLEIAGEVLKELRERLQFLMNVGPALPHAGPPCAHAFRR